MGPEDTNALVRPGDVVEGKYRVERTIGSGGMGLVVAARHLALGEPVALKLLLSHQAENREIAERLMREARATFRLRSIHTVRVHDVGALPSGHLYIVMELLEGRDLRAELDARGPLPPDEVVSFGVDACEALQEAHTLGIVHRDLKPGNLFLAKSVQGRDIVKVLDFGMSKLDPSLYDGSPLTLPETALGTPRYMAPEQWKSASNVDLTADIWALGIVMYELLTGKAPLHRMQLAERQSRLLAGAIPSPRDARPEVSEELARVVMRCLRADPRARWGSAAHLSRALRGAYPDRSGEAVEITRTGVTAVVPPEEQARRAALAFAQARDSRGSLPSPPTRPETPDALAPPVPSSGLTPALPPSSSVRGEDFDVQTEVRAPMFTPADYVAQSGDLPSSPRSPRGMNATLRSYEGPDVLAAEADPREQTLRLAGAPPHPVVAQSRTTARLPPAPAPVAAPPAAWTSSPPAAPASPAPRSNTALYAALVGVVLVLLSGLGAWLALRAR